MQNRIVGHTNSGNHMAEEINNALAHGCELQVRFKPARDVKEVKRIENGLLDKYMIMQNGHQRQIL